MCRPEEEEPSDDPGGDEDDSRDNDFCPQESSSDSEDEEDSVDGKGDRALRCLQKAVDINIFDDNSDDDGEVVVQQKYSSPSIRRGRPTLKSPTKKRPGPGATYREIEAFEKNRKSEYDANRKKKLMSPSKRPVSDYTGNHHPMLRPMNEVEKSRLEKGQTFQTRTILLLRTKEEANLRGISIKVEKSDIFRFICWSRDDPSFFVLAYQSTKKGYEVKHALVREMDTDQSWDGIIPGGK